MMIVYLFVFAVMLYFYLYLLHRKKKILNLLFFQFVGDGLLVILPNIIYLFQNKNFLNLHIGDYYQIFYFLSLYILTFLISLNIINIKLKVPDFKNKNINKNVFIIIGIGIGTYVLLNCQTFYQAIINPRLFYASTRLGGGLIYYVIIPLLIFCYFYYITHLKYKNKINKFIKYISATILISLIIYIFGQKAPLLKIGFLCLSTIMFKGIGIDKNKTVMKVGIAFLCVGLLVFTLYSKQQNIKMNNVIDNIVSYSDYIRNFNDLVDNLDHHYYGKIFFEDEVYSYIPRFVWKNKPELFGSLTLGLQVPRLVDWTLAKTGAPSFGAVGVAYADFGFFGIILKLILQLFFIVIAKKYEEKLEKKYNFWHHFIYLMFLGIPIFYLTLVSIPIYQSIIIIVLYKFFTKKEICE